MDVCAEALKLDSYIEELAQYDWIHLLVLVVACSCVLLLAYIFNREPKEIRKRKLQ